MRSDKLATPANKVTISMLELEAAVQKCLDREAIRDLPARYCHYVRTRNVAGILDLYAPDGVFYMPANMAEGGVRDGHTFLRPSSAAFSTRSALPPQIFARSSGR